MSQSTIWTQLAAPKSPIGTVPFVGADGVTIDTDAGYLSYCPENGTRVGGTSIAEAQLSVGGGLRCGYQDLTGSPGTSYTINQPMGRVTINAGQRQVTINNTYVFNTSVIFLQLEQFDTTLTDVIPVPTHGNNVFIIQGNAVATAPVTVRFLVMNTFLPA